MGFLRKLKTLGDVVIFRHTLFSMPMAYLAAFLAAWGFPGLHKFFWITVAMIGARNGANALNRLIDHEIDAKNPRTANRHLPKGVISRKEVWFFAVVCFLLLVIAAFQLNPLCVKLLPLAALVLVIYSYTKRFTWACHLVLGMASGAAPLGSWIAVTQKISLPALIMAIISCLWVAGFDIIYAIQDVEFDKKEGIFSIPAVFGVEKALNISKCFHIITAFLMFTLIFFFPLGFIYILGVLIVTALLIYEHRIVSPDNLSMVKVASYNINEVIGVTLFLFTLIDIYK